MLRISISGVVVIPIELIRLWSLLGCLKRILISGRASHRRIIGLR